MEKKQKLTTEAGASVGDNQNIQTAGPHGPALLQNVWLIEKLAHFNRERIPERIVQDVYKRQLLARTMVEIDGKAKTITITSAEKASRVSLRCV